MEFNLHMLGKITILTSTFYAFVLVFPVCSQTPDLNKNKRPEVNTSPVHSSETPLPNPTSSASEDKNSYQPSTFPIGINIGGTNVIPSVIIKGEEDGAKAIHFDEWLVPYETIISALKIKVKNLVDGQVELQSPGGIIRIDPNQIRRDAELGLVWSVAEIKERFGIEVKFNINDYAIEFLAPWLSRFKDPIYPLKSTPVIVNGLPKIHSPGFSVYAIEQRVNVGRQNQASSGNRDNGTFSAIGSSLGSSWFLDLDQFSLSSPQTWRVQAAQLYKPGERSDFLLGTQQSFWPNQGQGELFGFTTIQRFGFKPTSQLSLNGPNIPQRLEAEQLGKTIAGRAEPGTLVQLRTSFGEQVIDQTLVDTSGIYRFDNIVVDNQFQLGKYRVFLYPRGQLSATPEIREATFNIVPGQLPAKSSAFIVSAGVARTYSSFQNEPILGKLRDFRGGIAGRFGVNNDLTLGIGGIYDQGIRGLGELFFQPHGLPVRLSASALSDPNGRPLQIYSYLQAEPTKNLRLQLSSDRFSTRFYGDWRVLPQLSFVGNWDTILKPSAGIQLNLSGRSYSLSARATLDTSQILRWSLNHRFRHLELSGFGNETGLSTNLVYGLSRKSYDNFIGSALVASYDEFLNDNLTTIGWRYRSPVRDKDGSYRWETQISYGVGTRGSGPIATFQTAALPGLLLRFRYNSVSTFVDGPTYNIEIVSSLNFQNGVRPGDRQSDYLRTEGGILLKAFFDQNQNGRRDRGEKWYVDPNLILINNQTLALLHPNQNPDSFTLRLPPGIYRIDIDPSGFPPDWQSKEDAYAVSVAPGSYTPVILSLLPSYTVSGVVTDASGTPINGASVEAIPQNSQEKHILSITNGAGVYYLERLQQGTYTLKVNDQIVQPSSITLEPSSEHYLERNLKLK